MGERRLEEFAKLLGLGAPFVVAAPVYSFFKYLDVRASDEALAVVGDWIKGQRYKDMQIGNAVVNAFDNIYGTRLFTFCAFFRSIIISVIVIVIYYFYLLVSGGTLLTIFLESKYIRHVAVDVVPLVIISDYFSLFAIQLALKLARYNVVISVILAIIFAIMFMSAICYAEWRLYLLQDAWAEVVFSKIDPHYVKPTIIERILGFMRWLAPALLVHMWLPLFLFGGVISRSLQAFFRGVGATQWLIAHGRQHPIEAIGIVASILVFVIDAVFRALTPLFR
jgi:hypothetical protein